MFIETEHTAQTTATPELVQSLLRDVEKRGEFLILSADSDGTSFVQVAFDSTSDEAEMEYRKAEDNQLYCCERALSLQEVERVLLAYLRGDTAWQHNYTWESVKGYGKSQAVWINYLVRILAIWGALVALIWAFYDLVLAK